MEIPNDLKADYESAKWNAENKTSPRSEQKMRYIERIAKSEAQVQRLKEALHLVDATLCECRNHAPKEGCNCDIHAAHRVIDAALSGE